MKPLCVLVADDEEHIRTLLRRWLTEEGHTVLSAGNAREAAKLLTRIRFDLIVTDIIMPEGDGLQLIREFKEAQPEVRILAISGGGKYMERGDCLKMAKGLGAHAVVMKPFVREELLDGIKVALASGEEVPSAG
jgi:CheY-like chemotaxis protein